MLKQVLIPAAFALFAAAPAMAATPSATPNATSGAGAGTSANQGTNMPSTHAISQKLHDSLSKAGFTDIRMMPESFIVSAKDEDGNPVMMMVGPHSMTSVTALGTSDSSSNQTKKQ